MWRRQWHPTPLLSPGKSQGRRSLVGCSPWGHEESDMTERLHFHFSFHALEKETATHSSVLDWRIPRMVGPGGLPSMGSHRVGHDWSSSSNHFFEKNHGFEIQRTAWSPGRRHLQRRPKEEYLKSDQIFCRRGSKFLHLTFLHITKKELFPFL